MNDEQLARLKALSEEQERRALPKFAQQAAGSPDSDSRNSEPLNSEVQKSEPRGRKRAQQVKLRLTDQEFEQLKKKVEASGKTQQEYILRSCLDKPVTNTDGLKEIVPELKRIGNNLNQIAHALNAGKYYSYNLITDNQKELSELWQLLRRYLQGQA